MAAVTIEKVAEWAGISPDTDGPLDQKITDEHIVDSIEFLPDWEIVAARLGLGKNAVEGVKENHSAAKKRRLHMLRAWASANGPCATYRRLGEALIQMSEADSAVKVFSLGNYYFYCCILVQGHCSICWGCAQHRY